MRVNNRTPEVLDTQDLDFLTFIAFVVTGPEQKKKRSQYLLCRTRIYVERPNFV